MKEKANSKNQQKKFDEAQQTSSNTLLQAKENTKEDAQVLPPILEVKNLSVLIKDRFLVKNASFCMQKGECWAVLGEDKSGKTSLIKAISGSLPINPAQVFIDGKDVFSNKKVLRKVSTCFDPPVFFKYQTVYENLKFLSALSQSHDKEKIIKVLAQFDMAHKLNTRVIFLSYFEKKLMSIALALLTEPTLLLLDEPYKNIPPQSHKLVKDALNKLKEKGTTIIMTCRNLEAIQQDCSKFVFMENREIKKILSRNECGLLDKLETYAFVKVKYPHFAGKLIMENFSIPVKILDKRVIFDADEEEAAEIVRLISKNNIAIYRAGFLTKMVEKVFANLAPYYKEEKDEENL